MPFDQDVQMGEPLWEEDNSTRRSLDNIRKYIQQNYHEPLSIGQLAQMANISPKYFVDLFKKTYGQSAMDFVTDLRINRAKRYLQESDERLRDIAVKVGYRDEFYFSRKFKKEVGVSPSEYMKQTKHRIAASTSAITGYLLALGIVPTAAPLDPKWTSYYYNAYRTRITSPLKLSDPYTSKKFEINLNKVSQARPDTIIGTDQLSYSDQEKLMDIAPSFFVPTVVDWKEQFRQIAGFLSRKEKADKWIEQYEERVRLARHQMSQVIKVGDNIIVLRIYGDGIYLYWNRGFEDVLHCDLGIELQRNAVQGRTQITIDDLTTLRPDRMLIMICPEETSRTYWLRLQHTKEWNELEAVKHRNVYTISSDPWTEYSATAISRMLDETLLLFTGNCPNVIQDNVHGDLS